MHNVTHNIIFNKNYFHFTKIKIFIKNFTNCNTKYYIVINKHYHYSENDKIHFIITVNILNYDHLFIVNK